MAPRVGVRSHVEIILVFRNHDYPIQVAALKHCIKLYGARLFGIHSFDPSFFIFGSRSKHLLLHLIIEKSLNLNGESRRYFEIEITPMVLVLVVQDLFVKFQTVSRPPALVHHGQLLLVENVIEVKKMVFTVKNKRDWQNLSLYLWFPTKLHVSF
jgi:hypothetical protein